jgi:hypothetical protein
MEQVLIPFGLTCFLTPEVTPGVPVAPTAATDTLRLSDKGLTFPTQATKHTPVGETSNSASVQALMRDLRDAGSVRVPTLFRPSGSAGTKPQENRLWEALFGAGTVSAGVSVGYQPNVVKQPHTMWFKVGNVVLFATGCALTSLTVRQDKNSPPTADWGGEFMRLGWCGPSTLAAAIDYEATPIDECVVADSGVFSVGACFRFAAEVITRQITAIDRATDTLTFTPAATADVISGAAVTPYLPDAAAAVGAAIDWRAAVRLDGTPVYWDSWEFSVSEPIGFVADVTPNPADADYPTGFGRTGSRSVTAKITSTMRTSDVARLRVADEDQSLDIDLGALATAGKKLKFTLAQGRHDVPAVAAGTPACTIDTTFTAKASAALEDELVALYE